MVELLVKAKANPNIKSKENTTALMLALQDQHMDCVKKLLEAKADPTIINKRGYSALSMADAMGIRDELDSLITAARGEDDYYDLLGEN